MVERKNGEEACSTNHSEQSNDRGALTPSQCTQLERTTPLVPLDSAHRYRVTGRVEQNIKSAVFASVEKKDAQTDKFVVAPWCCRGAIGHGRVFAGERILVQVAIGDLAKLEMKPFGRTTKTNRPNTSLTLERSHCSSTMRWH